MIEGTTYLFDLDEVARTATPERVLWWAELLGRAERERFLTDAEYRRTRATRTLNVAMAHPKRAQWKVSAEVEADRAVVQSRMAVAEAERAVVTLRSFVELLIRLA